MIGFIIIGYSFKYNVFRQIIIRNKSIRDWESRGRQMLRSNECPTDECFANAAGECLRLMLRSNESLRGMLRECRWRMSPTI